jgi:hypothetical protein
MNAYDDYCELCDLPKSQCVHGQPPPPPPVAQAPAPPRKRAAPRAAPVRATPRTLRWTPPEVLKPLILTVLEDAGGELEADDLFRALEARAGEHLRPEDSERTPEGELRWHYAARRARVALIDEGLMTKGRPGVWQLA